MKACASELSVPGEKREASEGESDTGGPFTRPDRYEHLPPSPVHPYFADKLLLAIIDAHPPPGTAPSTSDYKTKLLAAKLREKRLRAAQKALFGRVPPSGPFTRNETAALLGIAREAKRGHGTISKKDIERWSGKTLSTADTLQRKLRDPAVAAYVDFMLSGRRHDEEMDMLLDLIAIAKTLRRYGIRMSVGGEALGLLTRRGKGAAALVRWVNSRRAKPTA